MVQLIGLGIILVVGWVLIKAAYTWVMAHIGIIITIIFAIIGLYVFIMTQRDKEKEKAKQKILDSQTAREISNNIEAFKKDFHEERGELKELFNNASPECNMYKYLKSLGTNENFNDFDVKLVLSNEASSVLIKILNENIEILNNDILVDMLKHELLVNLGHNELMNRFGNNYQTMELRLVNILAIMNEENFANLSFIIKRLGDRNDLDNFSTFIKYNSQCSEFLKFGLLLAYHNNGHDISQILDDYCMNNWTNYSVLVLVRDTFDLQSLFDPTHIRQFITQISSLEMNEQNRRIQQEIINQQHQQNANMQELKLSQEQIDRKIQNIESATNKAVNIASATYEKTNSLSNRMDEIFPKKRKY